MIQRFTEIRVQTKGQGLYEITDDVITECSHAGVLNGLINLSILHTSASMLIQENADDDVLADLHRYFNGLVPRGAGYRHESEGDDDMPAHIRSALTTTNLSVSVKDYKLVLGKWQGLFVFEHRDRPHDRKIMCHILGQLKEW